MFSIAFGLQAPVVLNAYFKCFFFLEFLKTFTNTRFQKPQFISAAMIFTLREKSKEKVSTAFESVYIKLFISICGIFMIVCG